MVAGVLVALLAVHNLAGNLLAPARFYVPMNLATASAVLALAGWGAGLDADALGLSAEAVPRGLLVGGAAAAVALVALALAVTAERTRPLLADRRMAGVDGRGTAYRALVRIPLGTVVLEEVAFRGVLPPLLGPVAACALFGLWHVVPTLAALDANRMRRSPAAVGAAVAFTALAGWAFYGLRLAAGSLVAPALLHAAANSGATVAAFAVLRAKSTADGPTVDGMATATLTPDEVVIHLTTGEKIGALHRDLRLPREAVTAAEVVDVPLVATRGVRSPGLSGGSSWPCGGTGGPSDCVWPATATRRCR